MNRPFEREAAIARLPSAIAAPEVVPDGVLARVTTDRLAWFAGLLAGLECDSVIARSLAARFVHFAEEG